jgi:anti-sigma factor RsiW
MSEFFSRASAKRDHRWAHGHMSDYLDGELASSRRRRMERHTEKCSECRRQLSTLGRMLGVLHRLPPPRDGPDALQTAASVRLRMEEPPRP